MRRLSVLVFLACCFLLPTPVRAEILQLESPWARSTAPQAKMGAIYLRIVNGGPDDQLVRAQVDPSVANTVSIHEMKQDERGMMHMAELAAGLRVPGGDSVVLAPGGIHLMLEGLKAPLQIGQVFELTLTFAKAGVIRVSVPVKTRADEASNSSP